MDIFGLTPIDSTLAAWGLHCSYQITQFLFLQTPIGVAAFVMAFLWSVWQSGQRANFKYISILSFIVMAGLFLFILPKRQVTEIKSATEVFNGETNGTAQSFKDLQLNDYVMPVVLSFMAQMIDSISWGAVSLMDVSLNTQLRFLYKPFALQKSSVQLNHLIFSPIQELGLLNDLDSFSYAHYLPSLMRYQKDHPYLTSLHSFWPGHEQILKYYSSSEQVQWQGLKRRLVSLLNRSDIQWNEIKEELVSLNLQDNHWDDQLLASWINAQDRRLQPSWLNGVVGIQKLFPYMCGAANFCLYVAWPFVMLAVMIIRRMSLFLRYVEVFVWIKSWILCAACSYYVSILAAKVQGMGSGEINWFWEYPYYLGIGSILLLVLPIVSLITIHQTFQWISNGS